MHTRLIAATALAALAAAPAALSAQQERSAGIPAYHLVQLSVSAAKVDAEAFETQTKAIRSCDEASELAAQLDADMTRNRFVRASQLPDGLRAVIEDLPTGHATPVFSADGETLRVLVVCNKA